MEGRAFLYLKNGDWVRAAAVFNELLALKNLHRRQVVGYLTGRSECFLELQQFEAVIADCRRIITYVEDGEIWKKDDAVASKARRKLIHALISLRRFGEAELVTQEWVSLKSGPNHQEATRVLERLHKALQSNGNRTPLESELLAFEARLQSVDIKMEKTGEEKSTNTCTYCSVSFADKTELRGHCQTEAHQCVIMSDEGRDWYWRAPPRGFNGETYALCENFSETGVCRYGAQCVEAHGTDELQEWKERFEYRMMKMKRACETELYGKSYTEELIEKLIQTTVPDKVMKEHLPDVHDSCSNKLSASMSVKNSQHEWVFTVRAQQPLRAVALLQDTHRTYFTVADVQAEIENGGMHVFELVNNQEWLLKPEHVVPDGVVKGYRVKIAFQADIYGTFRQSVIFDFGAEPVLVKHLCVDVIPVTDVEKINEIRKEVVLSTSERWNSANCDIVTFTSALLSLIPSYGNTDSDWAKQLATTYPCPNVETFVLSQATIMEKRLTRNNYRARMHELLCIEEMARYDRIARFNVTAKLRVTQSYLLAPNSTAGSTAKYSSSGELFALMHLGKDLSEDTSPGRLILTNCTTILFAPESASNASKLKVYEAHIEDKGKTTIYLRLSATTVTELGLSKDQELKCVMQFQLNRIPACEWHYAIDKIPDFKIIFPETYLEPNIPWTPARQWSDTLDSRLNLKQKEAVVAITTPLYVQLPPVLIIGPFGTGKTFTLAQAIKQLMLQSDSRILICTQSNSAADLYIKDYLHPFVESGHEEARPLRIYYHRRWVATVNQTVQKYCLIDTHANSRSFRLPTTEDILKHRIIVVTLSISMFLSTVDLPRGYFTHIFLDEAAQAMECEAIMPLALANQNTRIVLAGDHMQLSPELFSQFAKERNLHVSLLERLYDHYPTTFPCKILLSENYRAHEAIIQFTSESFYDQKLISSGKQPRHKIYYPLTFFTTRGEDVQDLNSTAFYNNSEVYEIVERVQELKKCWPTCWGKFDDQSIGVMTPYSDQVVRIRSEFKKRRMFGISVERVLNVQGKQFRAIFLSTVRTRRTCTATKSGEDTDFGFLSNSKLLNTAITRAQSLVAVVGDPIALCSIGRCSKVWERFIQTCEENKSLFGITWSSLRSQLDGMELKKTYVLNPLAPEFIPRKYQQESFIRNANLLPHVIGASLHQPPPQPMIRYGSVPSPYTSPSAGLDPKLKLPPRIIPMFNQIPQPIFPVRPPWPVALPPPPRNLVPPIMQPMLPINLHAYKQPLMLPKQPQLQVPLQPTVQQALPLSVQQTLQATVQQSLQPTVQQSLPLSVQQSLQATVQQSMQQTLQQSIQQPLQPPEEKNLIQFLNNVHFPEAPKEPTACSLNDYINLLPPSTSLAEMLVRPYSEQERWYYHLLETKGIEAAKKFEFLIHTTTKKEPDKPALTFRPMSTSYLQQSLPNLNFYNKPQNQLNFNQPVYLKELNGEIEPAGPTMPAYRRPVETEARLRVVPLAQLQPQPSESQLRQQQWQRQINADFANLSVHNGDTVDDMFQRYNSLTYASVVRTPNREEPRVVNGFQDSMNGPRLYQHF